MTIEQQPGLNRFVDKSIPLTWRYLWQQFKITLPVWIFIWVCLLEMGLMKAWLAGRLNFDLVLMYLGLCPLLLIFVFGMAAIQIKLQHRSKRVLQIKDKRIVISPAKYQSIRWKRIAKFEFEPIAESPGRTKLKLFLKGRVTKRASWAMVLENPSQARELIACLQTKKMENAGDYGIEILAQPTLPENAVPFSSLGISIYLGGTYLLLHGFPLLMVFFNRDSHKSEQTSEMSSAITGKFRHFILEHFSSKAELDQFVLELAIGLIISGLALLVLGWRLMSRKPTGTTA